MSQLEMLTREQLQEWFLKDNPESVDSTAISDSKHIDSGDCRCLIYFNKYRGNKRVCLECQFCTNGSLVIEASLRGKYSNPALAAWRRLGTLLSCSITHHGDGTDSFLRLSGLTQDHFVLKMVIAAKAIVWDYDFYLLKGLKPTNWS